MATIYGDTEGTLEGKAKGQTLLGINGEINFIYGDANFIENGTGGNDVVTGGALSRQNLLSGDSLFMSDGRGGNDLVTGGSGCVNNGLVGDAVLMLGSFGGNDVLKGGSLSKSNELFGDAGIMFDSLGGNDWLSGGDSSINNELFGDAFEMSNSQGGNDVLTGGDSSEMNILYGDSCEISGSRGGNDILVAGARPETSDVILTANMLYGDASHHRDGNVICGNDRLISSTGNDDMWGDVAFSYNGAGYGDLDLTRVTTGHDVFVFSANNGNDRIFDFCQGEDKIELQGIGVDSFDALMAASHLSQDSTNSVIAFGANTITVIGVTELTAADFLFT